MFFVFGHQRNQVICELEIFQEFKDDVLSEYQLSKDSHIRIPSITFFCIIDVYIGAAGEHK